MQTLRQEDSFQGERMGLEEVLGEHFKNKKTIWIDLDNSPHVPLFVPIIKELESKGHSIILTARDSFQVLGLADYYKLNYKKVGKHYGANKFLKIVGTIWRSLQLASVVIKQKPHISISHGSRALILLSSVLGIPTILMFDYEHASMLPIIKPVLGISPGVINDPGKLGHFKRGLRLYTGIKEDVYVPTFTPNSSILKELNLRDDDIIAVIRPPASEAHYHNPASDKLFLRVVELLGNASGVRMVILPRNEKVQKELIWKTWPEWCEEGKITIPGRVVDGLNLIWHSDLVISGGGTMNREAAALGVPVYSIFRGTLGAVDKYLAERGRLTLIETQQDVESKIRLVKRPKETKENVGASLALSQIMAAIGEVIEDNSTS
jgi:predicted glycosyltransferase